jgi:hypothetical protein
MVKDDLVFSKHIEPTDEKEFDEDDEVDEEENVEIEVEPAKKPKEYIKPDEVFRKKKKTIVKPPPNKEEASKEEDKQSNVPTKEDDKQSNEAPKIEKIKNVKTKRKMSEKQLENLAKARAKAHQVRKEKAEARKRGEPVLTKKEQKEKKQMEKFNQLRPEKQIVNNITNNYTDEDIARIAALGTKKALDKYEENRQQRKAEKKKAKEQIEADKMFREKIGRVADPIMERKSYRLTDADFWEHSGIF